jgi:hypothetical protein
VVVSEVLYDVVELVLQEFAWLTVDKGIMQRLLPCRRTFKRRMTDGPRCTDLSFAYQAWELTHAWCCLLRSF